jgi:hypothetical protein
MPVPCKQAGLLHYSRVLPSEIRSPLSDADRAECEQSGRSRRYGSTVRNSLVKTRSNSQAAVSRSP